MVGDDLEANQTTLTSPAGQYYKPHRIVLEADDPWVSQVRKGDRIVIWARTLYPVSTVLPGFAVETSASLTSRAGRTTSGQYIDYSTAGSD